MASKTKTPTNMMLLGVCRSRLLRNKVSIEKPPLVNDYRFWKQIRCNAVITQVQARLCYFSFYLYLFVTTFLEGSVSQQLRMRHRKNHNLFISSQNSLENVHSGHQVC